MEALLPTFGQLGRSSAEREPVDVFFENLPSPEEHHRKTGDELISQVITAVIAFHTCSLVSPSLDPDYDRLKRAIAVFSKVGYVGVLYMQLAGLAIDHPVASDDISIKARHLRYLHWVATGRKDDTSPFKVDAESSHDHSAAQSTRCAACGKEAATMKCSGCLLTSMDGEISFSTVYCGSVCQKKVWAAHKVACKQVRQISRAMAIFADIFRHVLSITLHKSFNFKSIKRHNGFIVVNNAAEFSTSTKDGFSPFPFNVASSPDLAEPVLYWSQCIIPCTDGRALVELFI